MRTCFIILTLILLPAVKMAVSQTPTLSSESAVSLITCGPGPEVYSYFGHSALRVSDPSLNLDRVYNYGTFDFNVPNFYGQFIDGKLYYMLSIVRFQGFIPDYIDENRFIRELPLNIPLAQKQELFNLLEINYKPENRHYWYDFFQDNCSTRIRDIVMKAAGGNIIWPPEPTEHLSYRQLIMPYISLNNWAKAGILLLLSSGADKEASQFGYMFLPDQMDRLFALAKNGDGTPLCHPEKNLFTPEYPKPIGTGITHPYFFFSILLVLAWFSLVYKRFPMKAMKVIFTLLLTVSGALGVVFAYMWFFSGHLVCHENLNLAWAIPMNLILAVTLWFPRAIRFNKAYSMAALGLTLIFIATFSFWKQRIPLEAILFCFTLLPVFIQQSGLKIVGNTKTQNQTN